MVDFTEILPVFLVKSSRVGPPVFFVFAMGHAISFLEE